MALTKARLLKHLFSRSREFAWGFRIEKRRGFLVNFFWSPFPTKRSTKTPQKIFGTEFGEISFCNFSDLNHCDPDDLSYRIEKRGSPENGWGGGWELSGPEKLGGPS